MTKTIARPMLCAVFDDNCYRAFVRIYSVGDVEIPEGTITCADLSIPRLLALCERTSHGGKQEGSALTS